MNNVRERLMKLCKNFVYNRDEVKSVFKWESQLIIPVCASVLSGAGVEGSRDTLLRCKEILEEATGVFSNFRGNVKAPMATMLSLSNAPEEKMAKAVKVYDILKKYFKRTEYLAYVASVLADMVPVEKAEKYAVRGSNIYELMKQQHPFLTSGEDSVFAVLMAFSDKLDSELVKDMETAYKLLKENFRDSNSVQSVSQVFALSDGDIVAKCKRLVELYEALKAADKKYGKAYELAVLASLSLLPVEIDELVKDIAEVDDYLAGQKGYGILGIDKKTRLMHAAMIVTSDYSKDSNSNAAAVTSTLAMVAAQQAAMCAVIAASAASAAAASSN